MEPYLGEIRLFAGNYAPLGWAFCNGQTISIADNQALYSLIGTTYGGDGVATFAIPDLTARVPIHAGTGPQGRIFQLAQSGGSPTTSLTSTQLPSHSHPLAASSAAGKLDTPAGNVLGATGRGVSLYYEGATDGTLGDQSLAPVGGAAPHENCQPFQCVNFIIALEGIYPSPA